MDSFDDGVRVDGNTITAAPSWDGLVAAIGPPEPDAPILLFAGHDPLCVMTIQELDADRVELGWRRPLAVEMEGVARVSRKAPIPLTLDVDGTCEGPLAQIPTPPAAREAREHEHRATPGGTATLQCHPGCPLYDPPALPENWEQVRASRAMLRRHAGIAFFEAVQLQAQIESLLAEIDEMRRQVSRLEDSRLQRVDFIGHEGLRIALAEARQATQWLDLFDPLPDDLISSFFGASRRPNSRVELLRQVMLPEEYKEWPRGLGKPAGAGE